jgi:hypothetical protein
VLGLSLPDVQGQAPSGETGHKLLFEKFENTHKLKKKKKIGSGGNLKVFYISHSLRLLIQTFNGATSSGQTPLCRLAFSR